jgi:hypothetical protein
MHSPSKWVWLEPREHHVMRAGETVRENVYPNGYMKAETLEDERWEIARRASAAADEVLNNAR